MLCTPYNIAILNDYVIINIIIIRKPSSVQQKSIKTLRFAPSPNGYLHLGHAYSALLNVEVAKAVGAKFIIRMEDIDQARCTPEFNTACLEDLAKVGVYSDDEIIYQSQRTAAYNQAIEELGKLGVLYRCTATRGEIKNHYKHHKPIYDPDGGLVYPELYKGVNINNDSPYALRLNMDAALKIIEQTHFKSVDLQAKQVITQKFNASIWGDVIIARKDIGTSYHLSVVVDDAAQNISHIIRGTDLYYATYIHRVLQILLDLPEIVYFHHPLLKDKALKKLSKSANSPSLRHYITENGDIDFISDLLVSTNMPKLAKEIVNILCD